MSITGNGRLFLLTGLSGSGKSTLGQLLVNHLNQFGIRPAFLLDGDHTRAFFEGDLAYSQDERDKTTKRMAFAAHTLTENNIDVVMANIAGRRETREFIRRKFSDFIEIYLEVDIQTLIEHDVKEVYKKNLHLDCPMMVGLDIPYDEPEKPDIIIHPYKESPEESLRKILDFLTGRGPIIGTKADTLASLAGFIKRARILPQIVLTCDLISLDPATMLKRVQTRLGEGPYILRSSCCKEDSRHTSNAGAFASVGDVRSDLREFVSAAQKIKDSYKAKGVDRPESEQILIQPMLKDVRMSGVVCTRYRTADSPYYVINYDNATGRTDTVTGGERGDVVFVSRFIKREDLGLWVDLIDAIKELEGLYPKFPLDIEFAVMGPGDVVILQCRPLAVPSPHISLEESAGELIEEIKLRFDRCQLPQPHLPGRNTILSDMADWNPSEMIGDRPSSLSYSIYRELITDRTWHEARTSQGYFDVTQANLMLSMARKPYIDTRMSFASFVPATVSQETRNKLVDIYLETLRQNRHLHDKVEFDVAFTCMDLTTEKRLRHRGGLTEIQIQEVLSGLRQLTNNLVVHSECNINDDYSCLDRLDRQLKEVRIVYADSSQYWDCFTAAYLLFEHTRRLGVLPFSRLARLAFIARILLTSLQSCGLITREYADRFLSTVPTVATKLSLDFQYLRDGALSKDEFLKFYGHLRMNTYDITSPRYDQLPEKIWDSLLSNVQAREMSECPQLDNISEIDSALHAAGLEFKTEDMLLFVRRAIQVREEAKFRFTRALSDMLEFLASGAEALGVSREELRFSTLPILLRFRYPVLGSPAKAAQYLKHRIGEKIKERNVFDLIKLPPVIADSRDVELVELSAAKPNFITDRCVAGPLIQLNSRTDPSSIDLAGNIVVIENADPGYDWIFSFPIAGLITKYGGVASHMAVRCAEFFLPGAIGCGELIFSKVEESTAVTLDCKAEVIHCL